MAVRNIRRHSKEELEKLEREGAISEDDLVRSEKELQKLTDRHVARDRRGPAPQGAGAHGGLVADDKRDGDDLFEDLDKFFAPIKDVDWDEPGVGRAPARRPARSTWPCVPTEPEAATARARARPRRSRPTRRGPTATTRTRAGTTPA